MDAPQENPNKVRLKLEELNEGLTPPQWEAANGFSAITGFQFGKDSSSASFLASSGIPVKVFYNNVTGEVRIYLAVLFRD